MKWRDHKLRAKELFPGYNLSGCWINRISTFPLTLADWHHKESATQGRLGVVGVKGRVRGERERVFRENEGWRMEYGNGVKCARESVCGGVLEASQEVK